MSAPTPEGLKAAEDFLANMSRAPHVPKALALLLDRVHDEGLEAGAKWHDAQAAHWRERATDAGIDTLARVARQGWARDHRDAAAALRGLKRSKA